MTKTAQKTAPTNKIKQAVTTQLTYEMALKKPDSVFREISRIDAQLCKATLELPAGRAILQAYHSLWALSILLIKVVGRSFEQPAFLARLKSAPVKGLDRCRKSCRGQGGKILEIIGH